MYLLFGPRFDVRGLLATLNRGRYLEVRIDMSVVQQLFLPITLESIATAVQNDSVCKKLKISGVEVDEIDECIRVHASKVALSTKAQLRRTQLKKLPSHAMSNDAFSRAERALGLELLKKRLPEVIVSGISSVNRVRLRLVLQRGPV